uniref:Autophagy-related protein 3 n=1 Tax=Pinguiococcus pyrenoidosus TaxID=172671 RepID=A0A7R9UEJ6_9STRA|mmetsp:Transcript_79/g.380  ORF Transcript_79/g.380 Transcript_79/m.380 type:complete len:387 (+) Transcript_79:247-1407(+)
MALLYLKGVRESLWPVLKESQFMEKGVLTPEEFVQAGDALVRNCPTWSWESGDPSRRRHYLPTHKQYLITRGVPSRHRVADMEGQILADEFSQSLDMDSEWMIPAMRIAQGIEAERDVGANGDDEDAEYEDITFGEVEAAVEEAGAPKAKTSGEDEEGTASTSMVNLNFALVDDYMDNAPAPGVAVSAAEGDGEEKAAASTEALPEAVPSGPTKKAEADDNEYCDILDYEDNTLQVDDTTLPSATVMASGGEHIKVEQADDATIRTRRYDVSISYDKYWQSPRIWLFGYNEHGEPLKTEETFEDIISDYRERTVTIDPHPHTGVPHVSIHPCQHAATMKRIVQNIVDGGGDAPRPDQYIFVFLKFIQSVVPTIDYDYTMQVEGRRV